MKGYIATNVTERKLKKIAFNSHTKCYVESGLCYLPKFDYALITVTVDDAYGSELWKTLSNTVGTVVRCSPAFLSRFLKFVGGKAVNLAKEAVSNTIDRAKQAVSNTIDRVKQAVGNALDGTKQVTDSPDDSLIEEIVTDLEKTFFHYFDGIPRINNDLVGK